MHIEIKLALQIVRPELPKTESIEVLAKDGNAHANRWNGVVTYWASSQVTMFERPMRYSRVKRARAVKTMGAIITSHSSRTARNDLGYQWPSA
jgi:hypothetical protein